MIERDTIELSIVVPVFREQDNVPLFLRRVVPILEGLTRSFEIIFALDPSPDQTEAVILDARKADPRVKLLKFSRRVGQPMATLGGLQYSCGNAVIVMDVDLQDPPEVLPDMVMRWREGWDVVMAQRRSRDGDTLAKRLVNRVGYAIINRIANPPIPQNTGDFRLMSRRVVNELNRLKECHGFLRGLVAIVGFRQTTVQFDRPPRRAGQTNYNPFWGSLRIGFNGIICFSSYLLTLSSQLGFLIAGCSFLLMAIYLFYKLMGWEILWGNPTLVILISFLGGVQLISVGILGEYIARIYEEVKERPRFIIDRAVGFEPAANPGEQRTGNVA